GGVGKPWPRLSSGWSLKPPVAGSSLKVTGQVLSRAAFEISHAPTISLAASLGACAATLTAESASTIRAREARAGMGNPNTVLRTLTSRARPVMPCRRGGSQPCTKRMCENSGASGALLLLLLRRPWRFRNRRQRRFAPRPSPKIVHPHPLHPPP